MRKLLIIALLIVGCAPKTTTNYYIDKSEQEFINNPDLDKFQIKTDIESGFFKIFDKVKKLIQMKFFLIFMLKKRLA